MKKILSDFLSAEIHYTKSALYISSWTKEEHATDWYAIESWLWWITYANAGLYSYSSGSNEQKRVRRTENLTVRIVWIGFRWTTWGVEAALKDEDALKKFKQRATYDYIVLFDDGSYESDLVSGGPLLGLKQAMFTVRFRVSVVFE